MCQLRNPWSGVYSLPCTDHTSMEGRSNGTQDSVQRLRGSLDEAQQTQMSSYQSFAGPHVAVAVFARNTSEAKHLLGMCTSTKCFVKRITYGEQCILICHIHWMFPGD